MSRIWIPAAAVAAFVLSVISVAWLLAASDSGGMARPFPAASHTPTPKGNPPEGSVGKREGSPPVPHYSERYANDGQLTWEDCLHARWSKDANVIQTCKAMKIGPDETAQPSSGWERG